MFPLQQLGLRVVDKNAGAGVRDKNEKFHPGNAWGPDGEGQGEDCMLCGSLVGNVASEETFAAGGLCDKGDKLFFNENRTLAGSTRSNRASNCILTWGK